MEYDIVKGRGYGVRVSRSSYRSKERVDIRQWFENRPGDPDTRILTRKGASLELDQLPELLAALHAIEEDAIASGDLLTEDYQNAGAELPPALTRKEAA